MSPSSSIPTQATEQSRKVAQSRHNSGAPSLPPSDKHGSIIPTTPNIHYTCFIRLPFKRPENFQDPPLVEWDSIKDKALWKLISKASNSRDLDWEGIATRFEVDLPFLLQQAAWLYERHFEGMKKQMQKLGVSATPSNAPSPVPPESASGSGTVTGGVSMQRTGSRDSRLPSVITARKDLPTAAGDSGSSPGTPRSLHPPISRTPSTTTVTQSRMLSSGKQPLQRVFRSSSGSQRRPPPPQKPAELSQDADEDDESALGHDGPSETDSEEEPSAMARSQAFRRGPLTKPKPPMRTVSSDGDAEDDEDDDDSGGYLPFAAATTTSKPSREDTAATLQSAPKRHSTAAQATSSSKSKTIPENPASSSASSASSAQHPPASSESNASSSQQRPGPISPRHRAQLTNLSPRHSRKDGSEGSPSMGSSFSDLDDASVTQSALEEALLSMQHGSAMGSMASRMSSLRDALGRRQ